MNTHRKRIHSSATPSLGSEERKENEEMRRERPDARASSHIGGPNGPVPGATFLFAHNRKHALFVCALHIAKGEWM